MKREKILADAKLTRIESDVLWSKMEGIIGFQRDHGNLLIETRKPNFDLVVDIGYLHEGRTDRSAAAMILQHAAPDTMAELVRGYRLAKKAGLLNEKSS